MTDPSTVHIAIAQVIEEGTWNVSLCLEEDVARRTEAHDIVVESIVVEVGTARVRVVFGAFAVIITAFLDRGMS